MEEPVRSHIFKVEMTCDGCAQSVSKVLNKFKDKGIPNFETDLKDKTVTVMSSLPVTSIMEILKKTGKEVEYMGEKS